MRAHAGAWARDFWFFLVPTLPRGNRLFKFIVFISFIF